MWVDRTEKRRGGRGEYLRPAGFIMSNTVFGIRIAKSSWTDFVRWGWDSNPYILALQASA